MKRVRWFFLLLVTLMIVSVLSSCKKEVVTEGDNFYLFYTNSSGKELYPVSAVIDFSYGNDILIPSLWEHMVNGESSEKAHYQSPVPDGLELTDFRIENGNLIMNFNEAYLDMQPVKELIFRASVVKTFTQLPDIQTVELKSMSQPIATRDGMVIGPQQSTEFVDVLGAGLDAYVKKAFVFYFASEDNEHLVEQEYEIVYDKAYTAEQAVIDRLIRGPAEGSGLYPVLPPAGTLLSVSVNEGICAVNFDSTIIEDYDMMNPYLAIYAVVNTLTELPGINSVKIYINGSQIKSLNGLDLPDTFTRNLDYVLEGGK